MAEEKKDQGNNSNANKALEFKNQKTQLKIDKAHSNSLNKIEKSLDKNLVHITKILDRVEKKLPKDGGVFGSLQKASIKAKKDTYKTDDVDPRESVKVLKDIRGLLGTGNAQQKEGNSISKLLSGNLGLLSVGMLAFGDKISNKLTEVLGPENLISKSIDALTIFLKINMGVILARAFAPGILAIGNTLLGKKLGMGGGMCCGKGGGPGMGPGGNIVGKQKPPGGQKGFWNKAKGLLKGPQTKTGKVGLGLTVAALTALAVNSLFGGDDDDEDGEKKDGNSQSTADMAMIGGLSGLKIADKIRGYKANKVAGQLPTDVKDVQVAAKTIKKAATNNAVKTTGKTVAKTGFKMAAKRMPFVGPLAGLVFGAFRAMEGDYVGAGMEVASGAASLLDLVVPGLGLGTGLAIEGALAAHDFGLLGTKDIGHKNRSTDLQKLRLGRRKKNDMTEPGVADKLLVKKGVNLNNLDLGPHHSSMDDKILAAYGKHVGSGYTPVITSARRSLEKNASLAESAQRSLHLQGKALDLRTNDIELATSNMIKSSLKKSLGKDYDVIQHGDGNNRHIHIEFDPKEIPYANGGIVPGNAVFGDRVKARVNSGEMILNRSQQKQLFHMANGRGLDQKMSRIDIAAMNSKSNMKEMIEFLENKFASMLSNSIAQATETAYKKRPKSNTSTTSQVDVT